MFIYLILNQLGVFCNKNMKDNNLVLLKNLFVMNSGDFKSFRCCGYSHISPSFGLISKLSALLYTMTLMAV